MYTEMMQRLTVAVKAGDMESVKSLSQWYRGRPSAERSDMGEALCIAVDTGNQDMIRLLVRNKAEVTYADGQGMRPIHHAARLGCVEVLRQVIHAGSPVNVPDATGASALHYAVEIGNVDLVVLLLNEGANVNRAKTYKNNETPLHVACRMGRAEVLRQLIMKGGDVNLKTSEKNTPLLLAVKCNKLLKNEVAEVLCRAGASLNAQNDHGQTALLLAIERQHQPLVQLLLRHGANPSVGDARGRAPLHYVASLNAASGGSHVTIARLLLAHEARVSAADEDGLTPLHDAAIAGNMELTALLLENGADINVRDNIAGDTPLNTAISHCKNEVIKYLVDHGADVNIPDIGLLYPLHKLHSSKNPLICEYTDLLLEHGAQVNVVSERGYTPLDRCVFHSVMAANNCRRQALMRLVSAGAHLRPLRAPPGPQPEGNTRRQRNSPLCWLAWHGELDSARFLVDSGWDLRHESWIYLPGKDSASSDLLGYLQDIHRQPRPLAVLCRLAVRAHLNEVSGDTDILPRVRRLPLPAFLAHYLLLEHEINGFWQAMNAAGGAA